MGNTGAGTATRILLIAAALAGVLVLHPVGGGAQAGRTTITADAQLGDGFGWDGAEVSGTRDAGA